MSESENEKESENEEEPQEKKRKKFTFKCTRCDACCLERGPIPITLWDLEMWARNEVLANFLPYLEVYTKPGGTMDLILKPLPSKSKEQDQIDQDPTQALQQTPIEDLLDEKCPLYNKEQKKCLVYENRPLSCRTYPLEFDGKNFKIVDLDCPGIGEEGMTKEELKEMREAAKKMYYELTRMRIALPVLNQIISRNVMMDLMRQNVEAMSQMSEEDRKKLDEIFKKAQKEQSA
jgi:Fe-S-cluster containining protein